MKDFAAAETVERALDNESLWHFSAESVERALNLKPLAHFPAESVERALDFKSLKQYSAERALEIQIWNLNHLHNFQLKVLNERQIQRLRLKAVRMGLHAE